MYIAFKCEIDKMFLVVIKCSIRFPIRDLSLRLSRSVYLSTPFSFRDEVSDRYLIFAGSFDLIYEVLSLANNNVQMVHPVF